MDGKDCSARDQDLPVRQKRGDVISALPGQVRLGGPVIGPWIVDFCARLGGRLHSARDQHPTVGQEGPRVLSPRNSQPARYDKRRGSGGGRRRDQEESEGRKDKGGRCGT